MYANVSEEEPCKQGKRGEKGHLTSHPHPFTFLLLVCLNFFFDIIVQIQSEYIRFDVSSVSRVVCEVQ